MDSQRKTVQKRSARKNAATVDCVISQVKIRFANATMDSMGKFVRKGHVLMIVTKTAIVITRQVSVRVNQCGQEKTVQFPNVLSTVSEMGCV